MAKFTWFDCVTSVQTDNNILAQLAKRLDKTSSVWLEKVE